MKQIVLTLILVSGLFLKIPLSGQIYQEVAVSLNINYSNQVLTSNGAGVSCVDFNDDGLDDISLATGLGDSLVFYRNTGTGFVKIPALVPYTGEAQHLIWVDYDNDGDKDLYVSSNVGPNKLYRNDSTSGFSDVSVASGFLSSPSGTFGACWGDINNDGWLDLYEVNQPYIGTGYNRLYLSNGAGGFMNKAMMAGVHDSSRYTFAAAFFDYDHDNLQDIYVVNDRTNPSSLYRNNGDTSFTDVSVISGARLNIDGMGFSVGDYDNNGHLDIYITNTQMGNKLLRNNGNGTFLEVSDTMKVKLGAESWGANFFDSDHDGDLDLYSSDVLNSSNRPSNRFFRNDDTVFSQPALFPGDTVRAYSNAIGDFNNDGFYDIVSPSKFPASLQLWESGGISNTNWVKVKLQGVLSNRDGIGSWIEVYAGQDVFRRYTLCGSSYLGQNSTTTIIGLASHTAIDSLKVKWLSGHIDTWYQPQLNVTHVLKEGRGINAVVNALGSTHYCKGDSLNVVLEASQGFASYLWSNGDTTSSIIPDTPGIYWVIATSATGFKDTSNFIPIVMDSISLTGGAIDDTNLTGRGMAYVMVSGGTKPYTYQWDDPMMQNSDTAKALVAGVYKVLVTDSAGCRDSLEVSVKNAIGLQTNKSENLLVYPNPASEWVQIETGLGEKQICELIDASGKILRKENFRNRLMLNIENIKGGIYLLRIHRENGDRVYEKLSIE